MLQAKLVTAKDVDLGQPMWAIYKALVSHHRWESTIYLDFLEFEVVLSQDV